MNNQTLTQQLRAELNKVPAVSPKMPVVGQSVSKSLERTSAELIVQLTAIHDNMNHPSNNL